MPVALPHCVLDVGRFMAHGVMKAAVHRGLLSLETCVIAGGLWATCIKKLVRIEQCEQAQKVALGKWYAQMRKWHEAEKAAGLDFEGGQSAMVLVADGGFLHKKSTDLWQSMFAINFVSGQVESSVQTQYGACAAKNTVNLAYFVFVRLPITCMQLAVKFNAPPDDKKRAALIAMTDCILFEQCMIQRNGWALQVILPCNEHKNDARTFKTLEAVCLHLLEWRLVGIAQAELAVLHADAACKIQCFWKICLRKKSKTRLRKRKKNCGS